MNNIATATAFETRMANLALWISMNGTATGSVERNTSKNTANAPSQSDLLRRAGDSGSGSWLNRSRMESNSVGWRMDAMSGGSASEINRRAFFGSLAFP